MYQADNGLREGSGKEYFTTGEIKLDGFFEKDQLNGLVKIYDKNGHLHIRANYTAGHIDDAAWREYYETGELRWVVPVRQDLKEGLGREYFENGVLKSEGSFAHDKREGVFKIFDTEGILVAEDKYKADWLLRHTEFYPSGKVKTDKYFFDQ